jgi:site-specific recombinase XerC
MGCLLHLKSQIFALLPVIMVSGSRASCYFLSPHRVRHSSITTALDKSNRNARAVQPLSRHADLRTVHLYDDNHQNLQQTITDLLEDALEEWQSSDR